VAESGVNNVSRGIPSLSSKEFLDSAGMRMVPIDVLAGGILVLKGVI
jgi:hypothetical protein